MRRNAKIKLVPAETIVKGQTYVGCLHGDTSIPKRSVVVVCEEQTDLEDDSDRDCFNCRFENGNVYPYMKEELFKFVAEYDVPSLANPRKMIGTNTVDLDWCDYKHLIPSVVVDTPNTVEVSIDFDNNKAKVLTNEKVFNLNEVITMLNDIKSAEGDLTGDLVIDKRIKELKKNYQW
jgi:hypothetical protein